MAQYGAGRRCCASRATGSGPSPPERVDSARRLRPPIVEGAGTGLGGSARAELALSATATHSPENPGHGHQAAFAPGTRATRIGFLIEELGLPREKPEVDLARREHKSAAYLALNPNGVVPILEDGDTVVFESLAIALYLADRYPDKGLAPPTGSALRGRYLSWIVWSMAALAAVVGSVLPVDDCDEASAPSSSDVQRHSETKA